LKPVGVVAEFSAIMSAIKKASIGTDDGDTTAGGDGTNGGGMIINW
jgi:hypothetical protein